MSSLYSAITDYVTGRTLTEGDRAVCIVIDIDQEPKTIVHPTDMATIVSLPMFGRVGEYDDFDPDLDDYAVDVFENAIKGTWKKFAQDARRGPVHREVKNHVITDKMLLAPAYVGENTFHRIVGMSVDEEDKQRECWRATQILFDAMKRSQSGDEEVPLSVLRLEDPCVDEWQIMNGNVVQVPNLMRNLNSTHCQLRSVLKRALKQKMNGADRIFDVEIGYNRLHDLQAFSVGLFKLGKHFQPSQHAGEMNIVDNASFMIGELQHMLGSAHLNPEDIEALRRQMSDFLDLGSARRPAR